MTTKSPLYHRHRFPPEIISYCIWLYKLDSGNQIFSHYFDNYNRLTQLHLVF